MSDCNETRIPHPGEILKQILDEQGLTQSNLGFILGTSPTRISTIVSRRLGISAAMSRALGAALGFSGDYFANLQTRYDVAHASEPSRDVAIRADLMRTYPVREMIRRGWLKDGDANDIKAELSTFFEAENPLQVPYLSHAAKRTSYEEREIPPPQLAWLFRVRQIAKTMAAAKYSQASLKNSLDKIKSAVNSPEDTRHIPRILGECGVRFVIVETLPSAKIDGVTTWLDSETPVVGISARFDRIDNLAFVIRHEIEHVLQQHGLDSAKIDADLNFNSQPGKAIIDQEEDVANTAAANFCVPADKLESFLLRKHPCYYEKDIVAFAKANRIHPGLVVGQIQHRLKRYDYLRDYQVKVRHWLLPGARVDGWGQTITI